MSHLRLVVAGPPRKEPSGAWQGITEGAKDLKQVDGTSKELNEATGEALMLAVLQRRLAQFNAHLYPLCGDGLLLSRVGAPSQAVPDIRAARQILRQWEGQ